VKIQLQHAAGANLISTEELDVRLHPVVEYDRQDRAGLLGLWVAGPVHALDSVPLEIYANTGEFTLSSYDFFLTYDAALTEFVSIDVADGWSEPEMVHNTLTGSSFRTLQAQSSRTSTGVAGSFVHVATVNFQVPSEVISGIYPDMLRLLTIYLVDDSTNFVIARGAELVDYTGLTTKADLIVEDSPMIATFASIPQTDLFDMFPFTGEISTYPIEVYGIWRNKVELLQSPDCSVEANSIIFLEDCTIVTGNGDGEVDVTFGETTTTFRVYSAEDCQLSVDETVLNRVADSCEKYQTTEVDFTCVWTSGEIALPRTEMNPLVEFVSSNSDVASFEGYLLNANTPGTTSITVSRFSDSVDVTVTDEISAVQYVYGTILTTADFGAPSIQVSETTSAIPVSLEQVFDKEGVSGQMFVYAQFEDGHVMDISHETLNVDSNILDYSVESGSQHMFTVPVGSDNYSGRESTFTWTCDGNDISPIGSPYINLDLPPANAVSASIDCSMITFTEDEASIAFSIPTSCQLSIILHFPSGYEKEMASDFRTIYSSNQFTIDSNGIVTAESRAIGTGTIDVSFDYWAATDLTTSIDLDQVSVQGLSVQLFIYPNSLFPGSSFGSPDALGKIHCSDVFERSYIVTTAELSNGNTSDVSEYVTLSSSDVSVITTDQNVLVPIDEGSADVTSTWNDLTSALFTVSASDQQSFISSIYYFSFTDGVFTAISGASELLNLEIVTSEFAIYSDALSLDWLQIADNLRFTSSSPAVSVDENGYATLVENSPDLVEISVETICPTGEITQVVTQTITIVTNLQPGPWDVDIDEVETVESSQFDDKLQFRPKTVGESFTFAVRVNSTPGWLVTFAIRIWYDPSQLRASNCVGSGDWTNKIFESKIDNGEILLVGVDGSSNPTASQYLTEIANCDFEVIGTRPVLSRISGYVSEMVVQLDGESTFTVLRDYAIVAGEGLIDINSGAAELPYTAPTPNSIDTTCAGFVFAGDSPCACEVYGDANNDCAVSPYDAKIAMMYSIEPLNNLVPLISRSAFSRKQMDPTYNYVFADTPCAYSGYTSPCPTGESDAVFILKYYMNDYVWLATMPTEIATFENNELHISADIIHSDDVTLYFEIATTQALNFVSGTQIREDSNVIEVQADDSFSVRAIGPFETETISIAIVARTDSDFVSFRESHFEESFVPFTTIRTLTAAPTTNPSRTPSVLPTTSPSTEPTKRPSQSPTYSAPSTSPTVDPTGTPSTTPSVQPTAAPSFSAPSTSPSVDPTLSPSFSSPSSVPSTTPSASPSKSPTVDPTNAPSISPSLSDRVFWKTRVNYTIVIYLDESIEDALTLLEEEFNAPPDYTVYYGLQGRFDGEVTNVDDPNFPDVFALAIEEVLGATSVEANSEMQFVVNVDNDQTASYYMLLMSVNPVSFTTSVCSRLTDISLGYYTCIGDISAADVERDTFVDFWVDVTSQDVVVGHIEDQAEAMKSPLSALGFEFEFFRVRIVKGPSWSPSIAPSFNPSIDPSQAPSITPSMSPSLSPSVVPTDFPSLSPTKEECATSLNNVLGSNLINVDTESSEWLPDDTIVIAFDVPERYTVTSITYDGATNDVAAYPSDRWSVEKTGCMNKFTGSVSWEEVLAGAALFSFDSGDESRMYSFLWAYLDETVEDSNGNPVVRDLSYQIPITLMLENEVTAQIAFSSIVGETSLFNVIHGFATLHPDRSGESTVKVNFTTELEWPWRADGGYAFSLHPGSLVEDSHSLIDTDSACLDDENLCFQDWSLEFKVSGVCTASGDYGLNMTALFEGEYRMFPIQFSIDLESACAKAVDEMPLVPTTTGYVDSLFQHSTDRFYISDTGFFETSLSTYAPVESCEITRIKLNQNGNSYKPKNINAMNLRYYDTDTANKLRFSMTFAEGLFQWSVAGVDLKVSVVVECTYDVEEARRRRLIVSSVPVESEMKVSLYSRPCLNPQTDVGKYAEVSCSEEGAKEVRICQEDGWHILKNPCPTTTTTTTTTTQAALETMQEENSAIPWVLLMWISTATILTLLFVCLSIGKCVQLMFRKRISEKEYASMVS